MASMSTGNPCLEQSALDIMFGASQYLAMKVSSHDAMNGESKSKYWSILILGIIRVSNQFFRQSHCFQSS